MITEVNDFYVEASDRWIRVKKIGREIVGINFFQGEDYMEFDEAICAGKNPSLTEFYLEMKKNFDSDLDFKGEIDKIIWLWMGTITNSPLPHK